MNMLGETTSAGVAVIDILKYALSSVADSDNLLLALVCVVPATIIVALCFGWLWGKCWNGKWTLFHTQSSTASVCVTMLCFFFSYLTLQGLSGGKMGVIGDFPTRANVASYFAGKASSTTGSREMSSLTFCRNCYASLKDNVPSDPQKEIDGVGAVVDSYPAACYFCWGGMAASAFILLMLTTLFAYQDVKIVKPAVNV